MLLELPLGSKSFQADAAMLRIIGVMDLGMEFQGANLFEALLTLVAMIHLGLL